MDTKEHFGPYFTYRVECVGADGVVKWTEEYKNLVTTVGTTDLSDKDFKGAAYTAAWLQYRYCSQLRHHRCRPDHCSRCVRVLGQYRHIGHAVFSG